MPEMLPKVRKLIDEQERDTSVHIGNPSRALVTEDFDGDETCALLHNYIRGGTNTIVKSLPSRLHTASQQLCLRSEYRGHYRCISVSTWITHSKERPTLGSGTLRM
jgi:hypothetical protein